MKEGLLARPWSEAASEGLEPTLGELFDSEWWRGQALGFHIGHDAGACSRQMFDGLAKGLQIGFS